MRMRIHKLQDVLQNIMRANYQNVRRWELQGIVLVGCEGLIALWIDGEL